MNTMSAGALAQTIFTSPWVKAIAALIAVNLLSGVALALFSKKVQFYMASTGDFLTSRVVPYIIGWGAVKLLAVTALDDYKMVADSIVAFVSTFIIVALLGKIAENLKLVFPGIPTWAGDKPAEPPSDTPIGVVAVPPKVAAKPVAAKPVRPAAKKPKAG